MQRSAKAHVPARTAVRGTREEARQRVALAVLCGIDLTAALQKSGAERRCLANRIRRLIERERLRGATCHWAYDLNRHIALKQVFDRLATPDPLLQPGP